MNILKMIRVAPAALLMLALCNVGQAQQQRAVLMIDTSAEDVSGALFRLGFERHLAADESGRWGEVDPFGLGDVAMIVTFGYAAAGYKEAELQAERNASMEELRSAVAASDELRRVFQTELLSAVTSRGYDPASTIRAHNLDLGLASRGMVTSGEKMAIALHRDGASRIVTLSWDDRQPLLAIDLRAYAHRDANRAGVTAREKVRSVVRYVGYPSPAAEEDPRAYWAADGAKAFIAEVHAGLRRMLSVVWDENTKVPKVPRKETTTLEIAGVPQVFPGRLWKEEEGAAYLFNKDRGITVVATAAAAGR